jgi:hypothetical protein
MRKKIFVGAVLALLALVGTAGAVKSSERIELRAGNLIVVGHGGFRPETLPKHHDAPIVFFGGGKISTVSGEVPPILEKMDFEYDRQGSVDTTGLGVCTYAKLVATDVPAARRACGDAIVGRGTGTAVVTFPEQAPIPTTSPITIFNGPKKHGLDTVLVHAHLEVPSPSTVLFPVVIERIHNGLYAYRTQVKIPKLANGYGHPVSGFIRIGRKWTYKGEKHSYINARCETGRLQLHGEFKFKDGTLLAGTFFKRCKVRE